MQMSRKTVAVVALVLVVIMLIPTVVFAKPVWFTASRFEVFTISSSNLNDTAAKLNNDSNSGRILNKTHIMTGLENDYREVYFCFDSHKLLPFKITVTEIMTSNIPEGCEDRFIAKLNTPISGGNITGEQTGASFIIYTAGMSEEEINKMLNETEICVKWSYTPGITGADYICQSDKTN